MMLTLRRAGVSDARVLAAFDQIARADFLDPAYAALAQEDVVIPLACGQTSLKPSAIALMLEALQIAPGHRVLLVGAGAGYAAAILANLAHAVVALERFRTLRDAAENNLRRAGLQNANVQLADGFDFTSSADFDRVLVAGALDALPVGLVNALKPDGVLVAPLIAPPGARVAVFRVQGDEPPLRTDLFEIDAPPLERGVARSL